MGHAGAYVGYAGGEAKAKIDALEKAGATIVTHPAHFGNVVKRLLEQRVARASLGSAHGWVSTSP